MDRTIDAAITTKINSLFKPRGFTIQGNRNGVQLPTSDGSRYLFVYCQQVQQQTLQYLLVAVDCDRAGQTQVQKYPIECYPNINTANRHLQSIEVIIHQSPLDANRLLLEIVEITRNHTVQHLLHCDVSTLQSNRPAILQRVALKNGTFQAVHWHKHALYTYMVLSDNTLFVYNLYSNYRELEIRLKSVKNYREIQGEFVDFDVCESWRGIVAVRLLTVGGCVAELLYLFRGVMVVERQQYAMLQKDTVVNEMLISQGIVVQELVDRRLKITVDNCEWEYELKRLQGETRIDQRLSYRRLQTFTLSEQSNEYFIMVKTGVDNKTKCALMQVMVLEEIVDQHYLQPIVQIHGEASSTTNSFKSLVNPAISLMTMSDSQLYYYNGNQLLQLDLTATADYFINDQKDVISRLTPYPSNLVFELPRGHTTTAVFFLNKTISVLTRGPNKYSFNTVPLYVLQVNDVINEVKKMLEITIPKSIQKQDKKVIVEDRAVTECANKLRINEKNLANLQTNLNEYNVVVGKLFTKEMHELKLLYEKVQQNLHKFQEKTVQRKHLKQLLQRANNNTVRIRQLLVGENSTDEIRQLADLLKSIENKSNGVDEQVQREGIQRSSIIIQHLKQLHQRLDKCQKTLDQYSKR